MCLLRRLSAVVAISPWRQLVNINTGNCTLNVSPMFVTVPTCNLNTNESIIRKCGDSRSTISRTVMHVGRRYCPVVLKYFCKCTLLSRFYDTPKSRGRTAVRIFFFFSSLVVGNAGCIQYY